MKLRRAVWRRLIVMLVAAGGVLLASAAPSLAATLPPVPTGLPAISPSSATVGQTLTCSQGSWDTTLLDAPSGYAYSWQRNVATALVGNGNQYTLTAADAGQAITCTVTASNTAGSTSATSAPIVPTSASSSATLPPVPTGLPAISPNPAAQGQTVSCSQGSWDTTLSDAPSTYAYSWQRSGSNIASATSSQYMLTSSDVNQAITCTVTATNSAGSTPAISAPIVPTSASSSATLPPVPTGLPAISPNPAAQGQTVSCSQGSWDTSLSDAPSSYAYSWQRSGSNIASATSSQYVLTSSDVNQVITCTVTAKNNAGSTPAISAPMIPTAPLPAGVPIWTSLPVISGTAQEGQTVTCSTGAWTNSPTGYKYSWQRNLTTTIGGTTNQYTLTADDVNQAITCTVVASNASGSGPPAISAPVIPSGAPAAGVPVNSSSPTISGSAIQGQTISCSPGKWTNSPTGYAYSFWRNRSTMVALNTSQYTLTAADVGQSVMCAVIAKNSKGSSAPAYSAPVIPTASSGPGGGGGGGGGSKGGPKPAKPKLRAFSVSPRRVVVTVRGKRQSTKGVMFHLTVDQKAGILLEVQQKLTGRMVGNRCVAVSKRNGKQKHCTRYVTRKLIRVNAKAGANQIKYLGQVGKHLFGPGGYRATIVAVSAGGWSNVRSATFAVVQKRLATKVAKKRG